MVILGLAAFACLTLVSRGKSGAVAAWLRKPAGASRLYARMLLPRFARFWVRRCDPAPRRTSPWDVFRAALTWRLFDLALLIAVAYPILLLFAPFIISGVAVGLGGEVVIDAAPFWDLSHLLTLVLFRMIVTALIWRRIPNHWGMRGMTSPNVLLMVTLASISAAYNLELIPVNVALVLTAAVGCAGAVAA